MKIMSVWRKRTVWDRLRSNTFAEKFFNEIFSFISLDFMYKIEMSKNFYDLYVAL